MCLLCCKVNANWPPGLWTHWLTLTNSARSLLGIGWNKGGWWWEGGKLWGLLELMETLTLSPCYTAEQAHRVFCWAGDRPAGTNVERKTSSFQIFMDCKQMLFDDTEGTWSWNLIAPLTKCSYLKRNLIATWFPEHTLSLSLHALQQWGEDERGLHVQVNVERTISVGLFVCLFVNKITQKQLEGFSRNLVEGCDRWPGRTD